MEKFKKYMGILDKVFNALKIAMLVTSIVLVVLAVIGFIGIDGVEIGEVDTTLEVGPLELELSGNVLGESEKINVFLAITSLFTACQFVITYIMLGILQKLIAPMKEGNVFHSDVAQNIKKLAVYVLVGGFLTEIINSVGSLLILLAYDIDSIFNPDMVLDHSITVLEINGDFLVYAAIIYLFSYVFKYGSELQTQVDETL